MSREGSGLGVQKVELEKEMALFLLVVARQLRLFLAIFTIQVLVG